MPVGVVDAVERVFPTLIDQSAVGMSAILDEPVTIGIAVLEALACGVPVVTTSAPANLARHLVTQDSQGSVCEPSAAAIAEAVTAWLARDPARTGSRGTQPDDGWLAEYSWDTIAERVAGALLR